ncbi:MAG: protein-L-isoaspartate(D-aspartate) O-methyltransferase [Ignavibacteria bacterium]|nr:protein-L-isoaspartate(D-aspartate) O-methyltransferase [Ignavibacteria bacterium]MBT8390609.1 protein-L-isoaspartate(D-aspartate) O-methyltransferase [Ignavibacteria bacterium]NNL20933.1 protein-L-isoaspartate(D-aspartate) O-methyltransferase [Ignavibacteriaceae bacterium]
MYKLQRLELVENLEKKGITDIALLKALKEVQREKFIPSGVRQHSYKDIALPIGYGQTISQPYTIGIMTQALDVKEGNKVLEIGTGSGYQAALLEKMGAKVYSIERHFDIYNDALNRFDKLGLRVHCKHGDGTIGWEEYAPFDKIIVTAGSPRVPDQLKKQLALSGKMVIPVGDKFSQTLQVLTKIKDDEFEIEDIPEFAFVPLIGREGWKDQ